MGRGKAQHTLELIDVAKEILQEIQPATVRAVCYRLFTQEMIRGMSKSETNRVSKQLVYAREEGIIPWDWIVDETREAERISSWADPQAYLKAVRRSYRRDHWMYQPRRVEVWSEKGTVRGTLGPVLKEYGVTFRVMHGFASATAIKEVADDANYARALHGVKEFVALYVGDWDPSGMYMSEVDLPERLEEYFACGVSVVRVALTEEDVTDGALPWFDVNTKTNDTRWRWYRSRYGRRCWELDALSPPLLRDRVKSQILRRIDKRAWKRCAQAEAAEQASLKTVLDAWPNDGLSSNTEG